MQKLLKKDKRLRVRVKHLENKHYIFRCILKNFNFFILIRWNALLKLKFLQKSSYKHRIIYKCLHSVNKKRFNKLTVFARHIFLKLIREGNTFGIKKASW